jgi:trans-aconitate methyltransferase
MGFFNTQKNVDDYIRMADGYDGRELIEVLKNHLPAGSTVLELGMGPGKDMDILLKDYKVTGSDNSSIFLDMYLKKNPNSELLNLDAITLKTSRKFDCIYSNKVLHHLKRSDLHLSFEQQYKRLEEKGLLMHSFWLGTKEEKHHGLRFVYYMEDELVKMTENRFTIIEINRYKEMEPEDSFYIILQKS